MTADASLPGLYRDPAWYDWLARFTAPADLAFYRRLADEFPGPVLELGCGTGRLALPMRRDGLEVTGLDRSSEFIEWARDQARQQDLAIRLVEADLRDFSLGRRYRLVMLAYNTLNHLLEIEDLSRALQCVKAHMADRSRFVIDTFNPDLGALQADGTIESPLFSVPSPDTAETLKLMETADYDPVRQLYSSRWRFCTPDGRTRSVDHFVMRVYFPQELRARLLLEGFEVEACYGNYDRSPFLAQSPKQLLICRLAASRT